MADKGKGIADDYSSGKRKRDGDDKSANRKRKNLNVLQFFEDSAFEVEESDSSDDDVFINDAFLEEDFGPDIEVKAEPKTPNIPFFPKEEDMDDVELEKILEERYKPGSNFVRYAEDRTETARSDERSTQMPLVNVNDPTIWKVKCMVGRERHSAFCLMQKYVDLHAIGTKLQIVSAVALQHVKGFIYIEAERQSDITEACSGLCNIYPSRVARVPVSDVQHLFSVRNTYSGVKVDTWARVKNGKYKGDLAQVVSVNEVQKKVTVKLVPRIDLQAVAEKFGGGVTGKKATVPAPRLITSSELEAYRPLVQYRHDRQTGDTYEVFDGMTLKDGYLFKKVPLDSLSFWDVRPSEAELIKFMPANKEESNDVEWLTGLFGERSKKKKQTVNNDKKGEKGEGSSSMENSFEVPDLVFHGRKGFGIVIGREKDDRIKVLEEGTERPVVVAVEARLLKKADFDKKFNALDQNKKIISVNNSVRVLEGPLEDKRGIVKQIYKGVVFVHDENLQENCGYFCAKAQICEKMESSADPFKGGKGGKSGGSGFDDFPSSPKSPLSPKKPFEGLENNSNFEDKEGFSVGQSVRIRVGPLKGYMCRVMAIRYSDITVKLDSQHKILTVKAEHLAEVKGKSSAVATGDGQDSGKPFDLLGDPGSSQGWMDGGVTSEAGGGSGGWNTGGQSTERSSWAPFPAAGSSLQPESSSANPFGSTDNDASNDGGAWGAKKTQDQGTAWGAAATEKKEGGGGGWGASSSGTQTEKPDEGGWGNAAAAAAGEKKPAWGSAAAAPAATETGGWGGNAGGSNNGEGKSVWGSAAATPAATETGGWGSKASGSDGGEKKSAWGSAAPAPATGSGGWGSNAGGSNDGEKKSAWGSAAAAAPAATESGGWGATKKDESTTGWGKKADTEASGGSSWGKKVSDEGGSGGWGKSVSVTTGGESGKWGSSDKEGEGGSGWGSKKDGGGSSWGAGGGSSWGGGDGGGSGGGGRGGSQGGRGSGGCFKCGESGHMSRECPQGGGGGGSTCYKCGESGHMSRECPKGGGGGGNACFKCGETGHMSRECPQGGGGGKSCFKCGESGHMSRECPQGGGGGGGGGGRSCYKCGESGHMSRECPQGGGGGGGGGPKSCFKCGETGHMSRECPQGGGGGGGGGPKSCFKCGETGHMSRECPQGGGGGGGGGPKSCFKCGESGHMSRECPQGGGGGGRNCYKCGESGHMSRECPQGGSGGGGGGGRNCYKCGESGHMSRECPQGGGGGGGGGGGSRNCYKCGESGHMSRECPQGGGGGGGGSYGGGGGGSYGGGGGWSSSGGWGSDKASDAGGGSKQSAGGWSSGNQTGGGGGGGWGSKQASDAGEKKDDAQPQGSSWGGQSAGGWGGGSKASSDAQGSGWGASSGGGGDQTGGSGWGSSNKKDEAEGSGGYKKGGGW